MADDTVFAELLFPALDEVKGEYYDLDPAEDPYQLENGYLDLDPVTEVDPAGQGRGLRGVAGATCLAADSS